MAVWQLIFTTIFVKIVTISCTQYGSLTFVIDDTGSMQEEINKVKDAATRIYSHINQRSSQIKNVVLVTFNDNDRDDGYGVTNVERARLRLTSSSKSEHEFANALKQIVPGGGGYCPEYCLTGTELALRHSLQNSYVFVFTDASPKDVEKKAKVIKDAQAKGSQIFFFLTTPSGGCVIEFASPWKFQAYYDIASATNGQVFKLENKQQVDEVLHLLDIIVSGEANVITSNETPANQYTTVPFTVDDQTEYVVVSAAGKGSGSDVQLSLITGPTRTTERVAWLKGVKVLKINNPLPGSYAVSVFGTTSTTVMIIGRTDFTFQHGFSETVPPTFRNDKKQPTDGLNYHLLVKVTDPNHSTDIKKAVIVSKDGRVIDLPLKKMEGDYYTTGVFLPPNSAFTIKIVGVGKRTGKEITRTAKTPIEPRPRDSDPVITTSGGGSYNYNSKATLTCKVKAHPKPEISWKDEKGNLIPASRTTTLSRYDYVSELIISNVKKSAAYYCYAENSEGENSARIDLSAESPFTIPDKPNGAVNVEYESPTMLECNIRSHLEMNTFWYIKIGRGWNLIQNSKEYSILNNGKQLKINKVGENEEGEYACVAAIVGDSETKQELHMIVKINHFAPVMGKAEETRVKDGESTSIKCNILKAYPKPEIIWQFKKFDGADFQDLKISNVILDIKNANPQSTGTYKCIAKNDQGSNAHETKLTVLTKPTLILLTNDKEISSTEIDYNEKLSLICRIVSNSATKIVWKNSKNQELRSDKAESLKQHEYTSYLTIPQMRRPERYTCTAHNEVGENSRFVSIVVKSPFERDNKDKAVEAVHVEYGNPTVLDCNIKSLSRIKRVWYLNNGKELKLIQNSKEYSILNDGVQLKINKVEENEEGKYVCVASIPDDSETKQESPRVVKINHVAPIMEKTEETRVRDGGSTSIKCKILKAYPKPEIIWLFKKSDGTDFQDLKISNVILDIKNANPQSTGTYKCIAKNDQGSNAHETKLTVLTKPTVTLFANNKESSSTKIDYNGSVSLVCRIVSNSATKIVWKNSKNQELRADKAESLKQHEYTTYLTIPQMRRSEKYTCAVTNDMGENSKVVSITVKSPFQGDNKKTYLDVKYGEEAKLTCNIKSQYPMKITWYNEKGVLLHTGLEFMIKEMNLNLQGNYTCKASLIDDEPIQKTRDIIVKIVGLKKPQIEKHTSSMDVRRQQTATLKCKILQGHPKPEVTWEAKTEKLKGYTSLNVSGEEYSIKLSEYNDTGLYKCTATNIVGTDEFTVKLTVAGPPIILSDEDKLYSAVEGDVTLRIPCEVIGHPKPTITWNKGNDLITVGGQFEIEDGVLIINNPKEQNTNYTCLAVNKYGSAQKTFTASVTKTLPDEDLSDPKYIYMLEKETRNFECKSGSGKGKGRWFKEWNPMKVTGTLTLPNAAIRDSGNYTCRVSDRLGSKSLTYVVDVGFPPTFKAEVPAEDETIKNWKGKDQDLFCGVYMQPGSGPTAKAEWLFNGKPSSLMSGSLMDSIHPITGWGNYTCVITNYHGSVRKNFYVHSKGCLLHLDTKIGNSPLILDSTGKWPELSATSNKYLYVKPEQSLLFSCHNQAEKRNAFKTLPSKSELVATCNHEDYFQADGKLYQYSNLQCSSSVEPLVQPTGEVCGSKNTEAIKVGYNLQHAHKFLEVYSVCLDKSNEMPVYSTVSVTSPLNAVAVDKPKWQTRTYGDKDRNYCDKDIGCCVEKYQLVNQMDVKYGPAQIATFNENLNSVFVWNNCKTSNVTWTEVEKAVKEFYDEATVWTGAVRYSKVHSYGVMFPQYLWKIARKNLTTETIVVVKVNNPSPRPEDILCATQCNSKIPNDKYTYCCSLQEFQQNFEVPKNFN